MNNTLTNTGSKLRKAAILLRSLDADTATIMLSQLSSEEAVALRTAMRELGTVDFEEEADVAAEFRSTRPAMSARATGGVALELSSSSDLGINPSTGYPSNVAAKRFEFLASAPTNALVLYLAREHAQTIAVVLAHLAPARAAAVLADLPAKLQTATIERLSALGETDPESVTALERELAAWMAARTEDRGTIAKRRETVTNILAATDAKTRAGIIGSLKTHNRQLAEQIAPTDAAMDLRQTKPQAASQRYESKQAIDTSQSLQRQNANAPSPHRQAPSLPRVDFDKLVHLDSQALGTLIRDVDANVLAIALAGSEDKFIDRVCAQMPKRVGRAFRRELRRMGPTRLSDVEAAQRVVADAAAHILAQRHRALAGTSFSK